MPPQKYFSEEGNVRLRHGEVVGKGCSFYPKPHPTSEETAFPDLAFIIPLHVLHNPTTYVDFL